MDTQLSDGSSIRQAQLHHDGDVIGDMGCPTSSEPSTNPAPVIMARLTGTTNAGAFSTEMFTPPCSPILP